MKLVRLQGVLLLLWSSPLVAQDCHIALQGHILEAETGEPLAYASVFVVEEEKGAVTDEKGYYIIPDLCENTSYTIEVRHVECEHQTRVVRLTENTAVDFLLPHAHVLEEIVILERAFRPAPAQAVATVDRLDMAAGQGQNLGETLKRLPGVTTLNTGASIAKPVIQGLHSNRIAIVSNNVVLEGQQWGAEHAPEIDPFASDKITVVKGAAGVRYGAGAMAGAVVLEPAPLRPDAGLGGWISLGGYTNGRSGVAAGAIDWHAPEGSFALRIQGTAKRSGNLRAPDYWLGNTGTAELDGAILAGWKSRRWTHQLSLSSFNQQVGVLRASHTGNLTDLQAAIESDTPRNNRNRFDYTIDRPYQSVRHQTLRYQTAFRISEKWRFNTQYAFQFNHRREYDVVRTASENPQISFRLWSNALDLALEHLPIRHWEGGIGVQALQQLNYVGRGGFIPDYQTFGGSVWVLERWRRMPDPWEFEIGARYDYRQSDVRTTGNLVNLDTLVHFGSVSANGGVIYHFNRTLSLTLNSGYAWRPPQVNELFARGVHFAAGTYEEGNPNLRPEKAWNSNLSLQYQGKRLETSVTGFYNRIGDFLYLEPRETFVLTVRGAFPAYYYTQNDAALYGLDASATVPLFRGLALETRASILRGRQMAEDAGQIAWLPLLPADRYQYGLRWTGSGRNDPKAEPSFVRLLATTVLHQKRIPAEGLLAPAPPTYTLLSLDAGHTVLLKGKPLEIGLSVQNLGNVRYRDYLNFFRYFADEPGWNLGLRLKWKF